MFKDKYAVTKLSQLIKDFGVKTVVETGTWQGQGVLGFSKLMNNVYSIEINRQFFEDTKANVEGEGYTLAESGEDTAVYTKGPSKITLIRGNSPEVIERIIEGLPEPILFFLDAHWLDYWPLLDELAAIRRRPNSLIVIDDFKVPGKPFGYDTYGVRLDWKLLKEPLAAINSNYRIFFNEESRGDYRGILYAVPNTTTGLQGWTLEDYGRIYNRLTLAGLPGEMAGHIVIQPELADFYKFVKELGLTPQLLPNEGHPLVTALLRQYMTTKGKREMADFDVELAMWDMLAIKQIIEMNLKDNMLVAEVGSWTGLSTSVLAEAVAPRGGHIYTIDHWRGAHDTKQAQKAKSEDIYAIFRENMKKLGVWHMVHPLVMSSEVALEIFKDNTLDFVFIDADHSCEAVKRDILGWWSKLKRGGTLCGHDCEGFYSQYPEATREMIDQSLGLQGIPHLHAGVIRALYDCFHDDYQIAVLDKWKTSTWYRRKP